MVVPLWPGGVEPIAKPGGSAYGLAGADDALAAGATACVGAAAGAGTSCGDGPEGGGALPIA